MLGRNSEVSVVAQASACVWRSVGVFDFAGGFHISDSQPMSFDESLTNKALGGSAVEEGLIGNLLLRRLQCNGYAHRVVCRAGL